jgi:hypothetical protein
LHYQNVQKSQSYELALMCDVLKSITYMSIIKMWFSMLFWKK